MHNAPRDARVIFSRAITLAAENVSVTSPNLQTDLFPYWRTAIHETLQEQGCPCQHPEMRNACFLELSEADQVTLFSGSALAYSEFISIFQEGVQRFMESLKTSSDV